MNNALSGGNDPTTGDDAGNGFLMRQGYTIVWSGWDVTAPAGAGRFAISVPVAENRDGSNITGTALEEFVIDDSVTFTWPLTHPAATADKSKASLTVRSRCEDPPVLASSTSWEYTSASLVAIQLVPEGTAFQQGTLYGFSYQAQSPLVTGLGLAAIRDVASFLHHARTDDQGNPNPLAGDLRFVYYFCVSQPCRAVHDLLRLGFNEDSRGRPVFDGMLNWIGGASGTFLNYRFAQPARTHRQHIAPLVSRIPVPVRQPDPFRSKHWPNRRTSPSLSRVEHLPQDLRGQFGK